jgi:polysaccharide biosynthesis protein PslH
VRLLFVTPRPPAPPVGGDRLRLDRLLRWLAARHHVTLMCLAADAADEAWARSVAGLVERVEAFRVPRAVRFTRTALGAAFDSQPLQAHYFHSPSLLRALRRERRDAFDVAVGSLVRTAGYLLDAPWPALIDVQDMISTNYRRALPHLPVHQRALYRVELPRLERYEDAVLRRASAATLVSPPDLAEAAARAPGARLELVGNGVDADRFQRPVGQTPRPGRILFLGNLRTLSNRDMVEHLARDVMPHVRHPGAQLRVVGTQCPPGIAALHDGRQTVVVGEVDDVRGHLWGAWITACPMRFGAGVANKILESLAAGTPAVVTPLAARALGLEDGEGVVIAEDTTSLASACDALLGDEARRVRLAAAGVAAVRERFDWERALSPLGGLLEELGG